MPPDRSCFTALNLPPNFSFPERMDYFTLAAAPNTDLWRKPPDGDTSTAPILFTSLLQPFVIAEVTVTADWEMEWDQGGLVIFAGPAPSQQTPPRSNIRRNSVNDNNTHIIPSAQLPRDHPAPPPYPQAPRHTPCKWVKAGLEFSSGTVNASSVSATADGADWCLSPLAMPNQPTSINSLRIKLERVGHSLWVWYQLPSAITPYPCTPGALSNTWRKLREVTWFFWGVEDKNVHVGVYASRPANFSMSNSAWATTNRNRFVQGATQGPGQGAGAGAGGSGPGNHSMADGTGPDGLVVEFEDLEIF